VLPLIRPIKWSCLHSNEEADWQFAAQKRMSILGRSRDLAPVAEEEERDDLSDAASGTESDEDERSADKADGSDGSAVGTALVPQSVSYDTTAIPNISTEHLIDAGSNNTDKNIEQGLDIFGIADLLTGCPVVAQN